MLWRRAKLAGFTGALRVIAEWVTRRRNNERTATGAARPRKVPSARAIARMMTTERGLLSKTVARTMAIIEGAIPALAVARDLMDRAAVHAALTQPWSNGQTEGQNTKLKMVKRQMYGRVNLDLLRARLLGAA